jgi:hypothetical protein
MSADKKNLRHWGRALDAGDRDDPELELAAELSRRRAAAPPADPSFKAGLRRQLLARYDRPAPLWQRFGRALTTAGALAVLGVAVLLFYAWVSQGPLSFSAQAPVEPTLTPSATPLPPPEATPAIDLSATPAAGLTVGPAPAEATATAIPTITPYFGLPLALERVTIAPQPLLPGETLAVSLHWRFWQAPAGHWSSLHLSDDSGAIVAQSDAPLLGEDGELAQQTHALTLARTALPGAYFLTLSVYDPASGARQEILSSSGWGDSLALGAVDVVESADRVWVISAAPAPGTVLAAGDVLRVEVGYDLVSAESGLLRLSLVAPDWQNSAGPQLPVESLAEPVPVGAGRGSHVFEYTVEASDYLESLLGPVAGLMATLGTLNGERLEIWAQPEFPNYSWNTALPLPTPFATAVFDPSWTPTPPPFPTPTPGG